MRKFGVIVLIIGLSLMSSCIGNDSTGPTVSHLDNEECASNASAEEALVSLRAVRVILEGEVYSPGGGVTYGLVEIFDKDDVCIFEVDTTFTGSFHYEYVTTTNSAQDDEPFDIKCNVQGGLWIEFGAERNIQYPEDFDYINSAYRHIKNFSW